MNCYNHITETAVAQCPDCGKGLCSQCATTYSLPICTSCNQSRISKERIQIIKELLLMIIGGIIFAFLFSKLLVITNEQALQKGTRTVPLNTSTYLILFYMGAGIIAGWRTLTRITPRMFLFLPLIGWVIYFILKLFLSYLVGLIMFPVRLIKNIVRLLNLQK